MPMKGDVRHLSLSRDELGCVFLAEWQLAGRDRVAMWCSPFFLCAGPFDDPLDDTC